MGYGGQTANGLSSLGPKMGKASGGGVKLEQGMGKISESQDDVLSGKETQMEDNSMGSAKMISGSHSKGKFMAPPKYKGPEKAKNMVKKDGKMVPDYAADGQGANDLGAAKKKGKTARGKEHQEKIHGNKPGYYEPKTGLIKVKNKTK
jgi:hypothetical protein|tara:strand:+ start:109 stop:552 length:444 start_codon:yes stop_codon:yes gene_type:complete